MLLLLLNFSYETYFLYFNGSTFRQPITGLHKVFSLALNNPYGAILNSNTVLSYSTNYNGGLVLLKGKLETS